MRAGASHRLGRGSAPLRVRRHQAASGPLSVRDRQPFRAFGPGFSPVRPGDRDPNGVPAAHACLRIQAYICGEFRFGPDIVSQRISERGSNS